VHGDRFAATGDPAELDTAVALHRYVGSVTGDDNHLLHLTNLASALMIRYGERGRLRDLDEAVRRYRAAVRATPAGLADAPLRLANLGMALLERHNRRGQRRDLDTAIKAAEQALRDGSATAVDRPRQEATLAQGYPVATSSTAIRTTWTWPWPATGGQPNTPRETGSTSSRSASRLTPVRCGQFGSWLDGRRRTGCCR
jgi:hypothetical protein